MVQFHYFLGIYCVSSTQIAVVHLYSRPLDSKNLVSVLLRKLCMFSILECPWGCNGFENILLMPSWLHASLSEVFLNSVPLSVRMAILLSLLANIFDR